MASNKSVRKQKQNKHNKHKDMQGFELNVLSLYRLFLCLSLYFCILTPYLFTTNAYAIGEEIVLADALLSNESASTDETTDEEASDNNASDASNASEASSTANNAEEASNADNAGDIDTTTAPPLSNNAGTLTEKDTVIETKPDAVKDSDIQKRISGIFAEIEGLRSVNVSVKEGVVSLSGEVPNEKKARQAVNLATRVSDVVAVDDTISRTLDVQDNVTPVISNLKQRIHSIIKALPLLLVAILVFGVVAWFGNWISRCDAMWARITPNPFVAELVAQTIKGVFIVLGLIIALSFVGAEAIISTLLGGAGVIGIAVGFAVKDTIENYIASIMLSMRQPFRARDHVLINDKEGIVVRLTSRATILMTLDGNRLRIPNSDVFKGTILNYTQNPDRRFEFELGVDANDDPIAAIKVGVDAIKALDFILKDPQTIAIIKDVGDSNIVLTFQAWIDQTKTDLFKARSIAIREAKHALENTGFSLPEPIYKLRFSGEVESAVKQLNNMPQNTPSSSPQGAQDHLPVENTDSSSDKATPQATIILAPSVDDSTAIQGTNNTTLKDTTSHDAPLQDTQHKPDEVLSIEESTPTIKDTENKLKAKERSREILGNSDPVDVLDATPDKRLMEKVEEEIRQGSDDKDLLSQDSPQE